MVSVSRTFYIRFRLMEVLAVCAVPQLDVLIGDRPPVELDGWVIDNAEAIVNEPVHPKKC